jgi:hypothetical protein
VLPADTVERFGHFLPADEGPWAVINGGFYNEHMNPLGLVVSDGTGHSSIGRGGGSGIFLVGPDGPAVVHRDDWQEGPEQALQSIDRLVVEGVSVVSSRNSRRATRVAVVVGAEHLWLVLAASESSIRTLGDSTVWLRFTSRRGLPLWAFADYLIETTDVVSALNLDGGGSANLVVQLGERRFEVLGERGTINALLVRPVER